MVGRRRLPDLRRTTGKVSAKRKFILYCEGKNTEPDYFDALRRLCSGTLIEIETVGGAGVPKTLAERAAERAKLLKRSRKTKLDSFEHADEVWAVFDRDEHPHFDEAVNQCHENGVQVARSNPCFEVWLILHFEDFQRSDGRQAVQRRLKTLCAEYDPEKGKTLNCSKVLKKIEEAEQRAERQLFKREQEGNKFNSPSTTVFELTRKIRSANQRKA